MFGILSSVLHIATRIEPRFGPESRSAKPQDLAEDWPSDWPVPAHWRHPAARPNLRRRDD